MLHLGKISGSLRLPKGKNRERQSGLYRLRINYKPKTPYNVGPLFPDSVVMRVPLWVSPETPAELPMSRSTSVDVINLFTAIIYKCSS